MPQMRERRLVVDASVCEDAHSYQDPDVMTVADAQAKGRQRCPIFYECMYGKVLNQRRVRCAANFGQVVAQFVLEDGSDVESEIQDFRDDAFSDRNPVADFGFIDPYKDPETVVTDPDEATDMVAGWANTVLYGPEADTSETL